MPIAREINNLRNGAFFHTDKSREQAFIGKYNYVVGWQENGDGSLAGIFNSMG